MWKLAGFISWNIEGLSIIGCANIIDISLSHLLTLWVVTLFFYFVLVTLFLSQQKTMPLWIRYFEMRFVVFMLESWYIDWILVFIEVRKSGIMASDGVLCSWFMLEISLKWMRLIFVRVYIDLLYEWLILNSIVIGENLRLFWLVNVEVYFWLNYIKSPFCLLYGKHNFHWVLWLVDV